MMRTTTAIAALICALALAFAAAPARAETPMHVKQSQEALERAKQSYNEERYEEASRLFALAAQIDPGAEHARGTPYRNMARCYFWQGNYDKATFWYDVYLSGWPKAADQAEIQTERDAASERRSDPDRKLTEADIYDRSLLELVDTLRARLEAGSPAFTADGGGTTRLYSRAIELGYAMPTLAPWSASLRKRLLDELKARWTPAEGSPLPALGDEPLDVSRGRLANLRALAPTTDEMARVMAWQRLTDAFGDFEAEKHEAAAGAFVDAAAGLPELDFLGYASALAQLKAGKAEAALAALRSAAPGSPTGLRPYYDLLMAEALITKGRHKDAAELLIQIALAAKEPPAQRAPAQKPDGPPGNLD